jgi:hypothetical protein
MKTILEENHTNVTLVLLNLSIFVTFLKTIHALLKICIQTWLKS